MTTEPKDVRGGDEPLEANAPKASDPAPVREAVAWTGNGSLNRIRGRGADVHGYIYGSPDEAHPIPLYTGHLPVSREAVDDAVLSAMRQYRSASPDRRGEYAPMIVKEATDKIILALTGETSRREQP